MPTHTPPPPTRAPIGGGFLFVVALMLGLGFGAVRGEPTIGFLAGAGVGVVILIVLWLMGRR